MATTYKAQGEGFLKNSSGKLVGFGMNLFDSVPLRYDALNLFVKNPNELDNDLVVPTIRFDVVSWDGTTLTGKSLGTWKKQVANVVYVMKQGSIAITVSLAGKVVDSFSGPLSGEGSFNLSVS